MISIPSPTRVNKAVLNNPVQVEERTSENNVFDIFNFLMAELAHIVNISALNFASVLFLLLLWDPTNTCPSY